MIRQAVFEIMPKYTKTQSYRDIFFSFMTKSGSFRHDLHILIKGGAVYPYPRGGGWGGGASDGFNPLPIFPSPRVDTLGVGKYFPVEKWSNFHDSPSFDKGEGCFAPPQGGYSVSGPTIT